MWKQILMTLCSLTLCMSASAVPQTSIGPTEQIRITIDGMMELLKDKNMEKTARRERLSSMIRNRFDFMAMSQKTLGMHWKTASPEEQERFMQLFSDLLEATYLGRIEAYSDERVGYLKEEVEGPRAQVGTVIVTGSAEIPFLYKMIQRNNEWRVYDVVVEEVSLIRNYQSSFQEIIHKQGFSGLLTRMQAKLEELKDPESQGGARR